MGGCGHLPLITADDADIPCACLIADQVEGNSPPPAGDPRTRSGTRPGPVASLPVCAGLDGSAKALCPVSGDPGGIRWA